MSCTATLPTSSRFTSSLTTVVVDCPLPAGMPLSPPRRPGFLATRRGPAQLLRERSAHETQERGTHTKNKCEEKKSWEREEQEWWGPLLLSVAKTLGRNQLIREVCTSRVRRGRSSVREPHQKAVGAGADVLPPPRVGAQVHSWVAPEGRRVVNVWVGTPCTTADAGSTRPCRGASQQATAAVRHRRPVRSRLAASARPRGPSVRVPRVPDRRPWEGCGTSARLSRAPRCTVRRALWTVPAHHPLPPAQL